MSNFWRHFLVYSVGGLSIAASAVLPGLAPVVAHLLLGAGSALLTVGGTPIIEKKDPLP